MNIKKIYAALLLLCLVLPILSYAREISLYDDAGEAVAYIDTEDEFNIYLWNGDPVAYLDEQSIYGFNGKHLGWFEDGIIWDHKGCAVGFIDGAVDMLTKLERLKGLQKLTPLKSLQQLEPLEPLHLNQWGRLPLEFFLLGGRK